MGDEGSPRRVAGLDVGSNSFLLAILEVGEAERVLLDRCDIVRLGEGVDRTGRLTAAAMDRGAARLAEYRRLCDAWGVTAIRAVGTAALREAANRDDFLERVAAESGLAIEVISGEREAELTYADVARTHGRPGETLALIDVGGGSTELAVGRDGRLELRRSLPIGSRRATERARPNDPLEAADLARLAEVVDEALAGVEPLGGRLVGTGGTITTLAAVHLGRADYDATTISATTLSRAEVAAVTRRLAALPLADRRRAPGLEPARADIIVAGGVLIERLMMRLDASVIAVSAGGLRLAVARLAADDSR